MTGNLRMAGYGLEPSLAFDFGAIPALVLDRLPTGTLGSVTGYQCANPVACRDSITGPDELVFHYRSPMFVRPLAAAPAGPSPASISIQGPLTRPLHPGQILQVACFSGGMFWAFVTVAAEVTPDPAAVQVAIPLQAGVAGAFGFQNAALSDTCFQTVAPPGSPAATVTPAAKVFLVERFRYFVQTYDAGGNVVAWGTAGARPYLMLDQGLLDATGAPILQVVAPDIDDLQVVYVFPRSAAAVVVGATPGAAVTAAPGGVDLAPAIAPPAFSDPATAPSRTTNFPSNIGAVRVTVIARSAEPDDLVVEPAVVPAVANRPALPGPPNYRRLRFDTSAATPNLDVRAPFFPSYSASPTDHLNVGGG
jgi:hypothetical protein